MAQKYADAIRAGKMTIEDVPARWRDAVLAILNDSALN